MAAQIRRLRPKPEMAQEEATGQLILALEVAVAHRKGHVAELLRELHKALCLEEASTTAEPWTFVMLSPTQFDAVNSWLAQNSQRPVVAMGLWGKLFSRLDTRTGEILASRAELAKAASTTPQEVSRVMSQLAEVGAIIRRREPANGPVRYFMNPRVGTHLPAVPRELAQAKAPKLKLVPTG
jgi:hypothetical protein